MQKSHFVVASLFAALALPVWAEDMAPNTGASMAKVEGEGMVAKGGKVSVSAVVMAIDPASRMLTLKGPRGNIFEVVAGEDVKRLDQIKVGDKLDLTYVEAIAFELKKVHGKIRERRELSDTAATQIDGKPSGAIGKRIIVVADVIGVDHAKQTITLRGPKHTMTIKASEPKYLKDVKAGDQVEVTYVQAVAVQLDARQK